MVKKLVESIMPSTVFDGDGIPDWGGLLLSAGSAIARKYNARPEQKLAHHTENTRHEDQLPSARSQPQPHGLPWSLDTFQQVIGENKETQYRRQLVTVRSFVLADRDFFSSCAIVGEKSQTNPTVMYRALWPKTTDKGNRTRHHDQCPSIVSFRTASTRQRNPAT
jgi:hypothetical protein